MRPVRALFVSFIRVPITGMWRKNVSKARLPTEVRIEAIKRTINPTTERRVRSVCATRKSLKNITTWVLIGRSTSILLNVSVSVGTINIIIRVPTVPSTKRITEG